MSFTSCKLLSFDVVECWVIFSFISFLLFCLLIKEVLRFLFLLTRKWLLAYDIFDLQNLVNLVRWLRWICWQDLTISQWTFWIRNVLFASTHFRLFRPFKILHLHVRWILIYDRILGLHDIWRTTFWSNFTGTFYFILLDICYHLWRCICVLETSCN